MGFFGVLVKDRFFRLRAVAGRNEGQVFQQIQIIEIMKTT
jgi:hypothetical protein